MEIKLDSRIISKDGILLFCQRYMNSFFISVLPDINEYYCITISPRNDEAKQYTVEFLRNELLDCEFLACRYRETSGLREAIRNKLLSICKEKNE